MAKKKKNPVELTAAASTAEPADAPSEARDVRTSPWTVALWLIVILNTVIAIGAAGAYFLFGSVEIGLEQRLAESKSETAARIQELEASIHQSNQETEGIDALVTSIEELRTRIEQTDRNVEELAALIDRNQSLNAQELAASEKSRSELAAQIVESRTGIDDKFRFLQTELANLEAGILALKTERQTNSPSTAALVQLSRAAEQSSPFAETLRAYEQITGQPIAPHLREAASRGIKSRRELIALFPSEARRALISIAGVGKDDNFLGLANNWLSGLVTIRPARETAGTRPEARLSQAEARLQEGDLAAALTVLEQLPSEALDEMSDWIAECRLRVDLEAEIDRLLGAALDAAS